MMSSDQQSDEIGNNHTYLYTGGQPDESVGKGITHVIVQDGVSSIDDEAFYFWVHLVSVHMPSSVITIGVRAFWGCISLSVVINLPTSLQQISPIAFINCTSLSVIELLDSLKVLVKMLSNYVNLCPELQYHHP